jgi:hypothetical protein
VFAPVLSAECDGRNAKVFSKLCDGGTKIHSYPTMPKLTLKETQMAAKKKAKKKAKAKKK